MKDIQRFRDALNESEKLGEPEIEKEKIIKAAVDLEDKMGEFLYK